MAEESADTASDISHSIPSTTLAHLTWIFDLVEIRQHAFLVTGMMNRNWRVDTPTGTFALKQIIDVPVPKALRSMEVLTGLAAVGLPVCAPRPTRTGDLIAEVDGSAYGLCPWAAGSHRPGSDLTERQAHELGVLLGRTHQALASLATGLPAVTVIPRSKVAAPEATATEADRFLRLIADLPDQDTFDQAASRTLLRRKQLLGLHTGHRPHDERPRGPTGWTHGDFQPLNILWSGTGVTAILDWDRLAVRPYTEEVVRTAQVQFTTQDGRLDLARVAAFTGGYRSVVPIKDADLADAVDRLWWKRMTDYWPLHWHYDKDDHGPDVLWTSGKRLLEWWSGHRDEVRNAFTIS